MNKKTLIFIRHMAQILPKFGPSHNSSKLTRQDHKWINVCLQSELLVDTSVKFTINIYICDSLAAWSVIKSTAQVDVNPPSSQVPLNSKTNYPQFIKKQTTSHSVLPQPVMQDI